MDPLGDMAKFKWLFCFTLLLGQQWRLQGQKI